MAWTAKQISDLDNSMVAAQNVSLGTVLGSTSFAILNTKVGSYTMTATDASANGKTIATGVASITGWIVQIMRSNKVATSDATVTASAGNLTVADGSSYNVTDGDVVKYIVW